MLAGKLDHRGHCGFASLVMPVTQSQIIPVGPMSQPPPPPVDAAVDQPPPLPRMARELARNMEPTREDQLSFRPRWRTVLEVAGHRVGSTARSVGGWVAVGGHRVAAVGRAKAQSLAPLVGRVRLRLSMWWLVAVGWVVNQAGRLPRVQFALARREQTLAEQRAVSSRAMGLTHRRPGPQDVTALRELEGRLQTLLAQLDIQRIAGSDNTPKEAAAISVPRAPVDVAEIGGRVVGIMERGL